MGQIWIMCEELSGAWWTLRMLMISWHSKSPRWGLWSTLSGAGNCKQRRLRSLRAILLSCLRVQGPAPLSTLYQTLSPGSRTCKWDFHVTRAFWHFSTNLGVWGLRQSSPILRIVLQQTVFYLGSNLSFLRGGKTIPASRNRCILPYLWCRKNK